MLKQWKIEPLYTARGNVKDVTLKNNLAVPQKVKYRVTIGLINSTLRYKSKRNKNIHQHKTCT